MCIRDSRKVRQVLKDVRAHRVAREVVLDAPDGLESQALGEAPEAELVRIDLEIRTRRIRGLEDQPEPDVHGDGCRGSEALPAIRGARPRWTAGRPAM